MDNIYLLYGLEKSLIDKEIELIKKKINIELVNIIPYDLTINSLDDVMDEILTPSMFSLNKLIIVNNSEIFISSKYETELLEKYIKNYDKNIYIIFTCLTEKLDNRRKITKLVDEYGKIIELKKGDQSYITNYTKNYISENGYKINSYDLNSFILKVGNNLNIITSELDKLFMYKIDDKTITIDDINKIIVKNIEDDIFKLTDAIIKKDKSKTIDLYNNFINNNYEITYLLGLLVSQFRFLFQVKRLSNQNKSNDEIINILKVHPYRVKIAITNNYQYMEKDLLKYIDKLFNVEKNIKTGRMNKFIAMELFLLDM